MVGIDFAAENSSGFESARVEFAAKKFSGMRFGGFGTGFERIGEAMESERVPEYIHRRLLAWRRWCLSAWLPREFHVVCESAEKWHTPEKGNVHDDPASLPESIRRTYPQALDHEALAIERALLRLPRKAALAIRLHYIGYPRIPVKQKMRALGLEHDRYWTFVVDSAGALAHMLHWQA